MIEKISEKQIAINLRKSGKTYNDILKIVHVAKSTLSLWLRDVGLSKRQKQQITQGRLEAQRKGGAKRREQRLEKIKNIFGTAQRDLGRLTRRDLLILGVALYWAEGTKERYDRPGSGIQFANSDHKMLHLFVLWLLTFGGAVKNDIVLDLYLHINHKHRLTEIKKFWESKLGLHVTHVYFKRHNPKTNRVNSGANYHGLIALRMRSSSHVVRKLAGLVSAINGCSNNWGMV